VTRCKVKSRFLGFFAVGVYTERDTPVPLGVPNVLIDNSTINTRAYATLPQRGPLSVATSAVQACPPSFRPPPWIQRKLRTPEARSLRSLLWLRHRKGTLAKPRSQVH